MSKNLAISSQYRDMKGTRRVKNMRAQGLIPAVVYGNDKETLAISLDSKELVKVFGKQRISENRLIDLQVEKDKQKIKKTVIVKGIQKEPLSGAYLHLDFFEISMDKKLRTEVPIVLTGECPGLALGGVLEHLLRMMEVECLPKDMPEKIVVDISSLQIGKSIHVSDIQAPADTKLLNPADQIVVTVKAVKEEAPAEAAVTTEAEAAEPELITKKKKEGEEAEEDAQEAKEGSK